MDIADKLRVMLPHWIEHNSSHGKEFADWAEQIEESNGELAEQLHKAVNALEHAQQALEKALNIAGGPATPQQQTNHGHHHHHH